MMKRCRDCGPKPLEEFRPYKASPDGLRAFCHECWNRRAREAYTPTPIRDFGMSDIPRDALRYIAGFVDGEGYIGVNRVRSSNGHQRVTWQSRVSIVNTHRGSMEYLSGHLGRPICERQPSVSGYRLQYLVQLTGSRAFAFLRVIKEHLIIKRQQAELVLQMPAYGSDRPLKRVGRLGKGWAARTPEQFAECERIWLAIKALNRPPK